MKNSTRILLPFLFAAFAVPTTAYAQSASQLLIQELRLMRQAGVDTFDLELNECAKITDPLRQRAVAMLPEMRSAAPEDRIDLFNAQSDTMSCMSCSSQTQKRKQHCDSLRTTLDAIEKRWREPAAEPIQDLTPW